MHSNFYDRSGNEASTAKAKSLDVIISLGQHKVAQEKNMSGGKRYDIYI
jgi:hypothetical protein